MTPSRQRWLNHTNLTLHFRERCCDSTSALRQESVFRKFSSTCNFLKFVVRFCIQFSILQSPSLNCPVSLSWSADSASSVRSFLVVFFPRFSSGAVDCFLSVKNEQRFGCTPGQRASLMPAAAIKLFTPLTSLESCQDPEHQDHAAGKELGERWCLVEAPLHAVWGSDFHPCSWSGLCHSLDPAWLCPLLTLASLFLALDCFVPMDLSGKWDWVWPWLLSPVCSAGPMQVPGLPDTVLAQLFILSGVASPCRSLTKTVRKNLRFKSNAN